jgi:hypothetical protein
MDLLGFLIGRRLANKEAQGRKITAGRGNIGPTGSNISVGPYSSTALPMMWAA